MGVRYPWRTLASPLQCLLTDVQLDGRPVDESRIDRNHLRLHIGTGRWSGFDCDITVATDEPLPSDLDEFSVHLLVASTQSNLRVPLPLGPLSGTSSAGHVTVRRSTVAGTFTLHAQATAKTGERRRVVGDSEPWTAVLDVNAAPSDPGVAPFEFVWVDFRSAGAPLVAQEHPTALSVMDLYPQPRLLLNAGVEGLRALLHNDNAKLERRRMRDILNAAISRQATTALFRAAAAEVALNGDDLIHPPASALLRQTCEAVAQRMPGIGSVDELYERMATVETTDVEFWTRVELAIDVLTEQADKLSTAAREVANG